MTPTDRNYRIETRDRIIALLRALPNDVARVQILAAAVTALRLMRQANRTFDAMLEGEHLRQGRYASRDEQIILGRKS